MSTYAAELAQARLDALRALRESLASAETSTQKRLAATAILKAPKPSELDEHLDGSPAPRLPCSPAHPTPSPPHPHSAAADSPPRPTPSLPDMMRKLDIPEKLVARFERNLAAGDVPAPLLAAIHTRTGPHPP